MPLTADSLNRESGAKSERFKSGAVPAAVDLVSVRLTIQPSHCRKMGRPSDER